MLNVDRRPDVDSRLEQLLDVLPALGVTRPRIALDEIRVGEFVDEQRCGSALQRGVQIELAPREAAILHVEERQALEPLEKALGLGSAVRLHVAHHDIDAVRPRGARGLQHRVGLSHARGCPEEDLQAAAFSSRLVPLQRCQ